MRLFNSISDFYKDIKRQEKENDTMASNLSSRYAKLIAQANAASQTNYVTAAPTLNTNLGYVGPSTGTYTVTGVASSTSPFYGVYGGIAPQGGLYIGGNPNNNVNAIHQANPSVPYPTAQITRMTFYDAAGVAHIMDVDLAYYQLLIQISGNHSVSSTIKFGASPKPTMVEGDFSMDELEVAEQLIEEMNAEKQVSA